MSILRKGQWFFNPYSRRGAIRAARKDATTSPTIPAYGSREHPHYIQQLKEVGDRMVRDVLESWTAKDEPLLAELRALERELDEANRRLPRAQAAYQEAKTLFEEASPDKRAETARHGLIAYRVASVLLFLFEFPMNWVVFQVLGDNGLLNALMTCAVGAPLLGCAHFAGKFTRQGPFGNRWRGVLFVLTLLGPAIVILFVAKIRGAYFAQSEIESSIDRGTLFFAFAAFNCGVFIIAWVFSYFVHLEGLDGVIVARQALEAARRSHKRTEQAIRAVWTSRATLHRSHVTQARQVNDLFGELLHVYYEYNARERSDRDAGNATQRPVDPWLISVTMPKQLLAGWVSGADPQRGEHDSPQRTLAAVVSPTAKTEENTQNVQKDESSPA